MPICYWERCHCPDFEPCVEHAGFNCSRWGGIVVTQLNQINDARTHQADLAIMTLDADQTKFEEMEQRMEARKVELEREKQDLEAMISSANSIGERRAVVRRVEAAYVKIGEIEQEVRQILADEAIMNAQGGPLQGVLMPWLIVPYTSPAGYCACYDVKRAKLAAIAGATAAERANLTPLFAQVGAIRAQVFGIVSALPNPRNVGKLLGSVLVGAALLAYIFFGLEVALIVTLIGLLIIAIVVLVTLLMLLSINAQIAAIRQRIVKLDLSYYRMQSISTCLQAGLPGSEVEPPEDENAWWEEAGAVELPGESPPGGE